LSNEGNAKAAALTGQAADRIDRLGSYLEQKRGDELMRDVETFARSRPWMLAGLGMLAGVAAARFMKASSEQRYGGARRSNQQWPTRQGVPASPGGGYPQSQLEGGHVNEPATGGPDIPSALSDDPLARDPYAETR
jgi:hypothetical protein